MTNSRAHSTAAYEPSRAPRGASMSCQGWQQEAALRMLMNSLDPEVAEHPEQLNLPGDSGKPARNRECFHAIVASLRGLSGEQTLIVQSGKPVGVFRTHPDAPRVLIANGNLVGRWDTAQQFAKVEQAGLSMFGRALVGSWLYVGTQGALTTACEIFAAAARKHFGGTLAGRLVVSSGMGGTGGAYPLGATLNGASFLGIEADPERIKRRIRGGFCEVMVTSLDEALRILKNAVFSRQATSVGLAGNCAELIPELARRGVVPDLLTDMTPAREPLCGYVPEGLSPEQAAGLRRSDGPSYRERALDSIAKHVRSMLELQKLGSVVFASRNNARALAYQCGVEGAASIPGYVSEYLRPLLCEGRAPLLWVALSGDSHDISRSDQQLLDLLPPQKSVQKRIGAAQRIRSQGLPSRVCWLGDNERVKFGLALNSLVARGQVSAPFVLAAVQMTGAASASPFGETEKMPDDSDAIADWPLLRALLSASSGAAWVSIENGDGVGVGYALHANQALVADGTEEAAARIERALTNEAGLGLVRHANAGYTEAQDRTRKRDTTPPLP